MRWWRFLKYEKPYLLLFLAGFLIVMATFYTDPAIAWQWETFFYALVLVLILLAGFVILRYWRNLQAIRHMHREDAENLSLEAHHYHRILEEMRQEHIRALNEVQAKQNEYYNFIVTWFHEIKTPIAVLRLMQQTEMDRKSLDEEVSRIEHYVDQALYYAKLDSFNQDYEIRNCDLEPLVKNLVKSHSKTFISRKIRIQLDLKSTIVQSDSKWLNYIVNQILTNSLKYTGDDGEVSIATRVTPQEKSLVIRDNGIGIDPKDLPRIFNRGFTGTNGRSHTKSTGMGLYLAQELSNKLGHYITCESEVGQYTEMTVHFPKNHDPYMSTVKPFKEL
ncbi:sensor histidine kinase [Cohnella cholangitidis]|uniref:histidine kinase n=1 Tax=Cohnella cholangitidis TaxID=2598458 RepID=A0A7G5BYE5_9BACL|nr:sensor histidine kinase [Cohnella cholangitidis]QMV41979.1 HAMP domain-containing histidine kinase [Cohnella cholangitidis]